MYWVWSDERSDDEQAFIYGRPQVLRDLGIRFDQGTRITQDVPLIEIPIDADSRGQLTENLLAPGTTGLLFSSRLRDVLASVAVDNIDYYDCVLIDEEDGSKNHEYKLANIIGRAACLDAANSELMMAPSDPTAILAIDKLSIDEDMIEDILILRLDEFLPVILAHEKVKNAVEEAGITGVRFYLPSEYTL